MRNEQNEILFVLQVSIALILLVVVVAATTPASASTSTVSPSPHIIRYIALGIIVAAIIGVLYIRSRRRRDVPPT